ncbi:hypothetical protein AX15_006263 [Amanita polypyramis BW_CC]|nr:hypothetical protein AX15_006263 [Amanita polypyramis BW_CC]
MERRRQQLIQDRRSWGDPTPRDPAKSGSAPREVVNHCLATYKTTAARLGISPMKFSLPQQSPISARRMPISVQGWSFDDLVSKSSNFKAVRRISALNKASLNPAELDKYDKEGVPLIIEDFHRHPRWPHEFTLEHFKSHGPSEIGVRNVLNGIDMVIPTSEFIDKCHASTTFVAQHGKDQERLYGKDIECPGEWQKLLGQFGIPTRLLPGSDYDLLSNQPSEGRVKTLMCYFGIGDTFTPCHKDLCASSGQNLMCYAENNGSSFWFMTATEDVFAATTYFHLINKELDHESSIVTIEELSNAPFTVYIAEQKLGDFVLVPSRSCHQVINHGGITIKTSWSRMTLDGLITAYYHELPIYQRIGRAETYRVKYTIYHALMSFTERIKQLEAGGRSTARLAMGAGNSTVAKRKRLLNGLRQLLEVFEDVLLNEKCYPGIAEKISLIANLPGKPSPSSNAADDTGGDRITCDFCEADIFQSFFECRQCVENPEQVTPGYGCTICPRCYTDGRSCQCGSMNPMRCRPFDDLLKVLNEASDLLKKCNSNQAGDRACDKEKSAEFGIFAAGCLRNQISNFNATVKCSTHGAMHDIRKFNSLYCSGCHKSSCFQHILAKYETHAVDALLDSASPDKEQYHKQYHDSNRSCISEQDITKFAESVKRGSCPDARFQRYHITTFYTKCLTASKYVRRGYYDEGWTKQDSIEQYTYTRPADQMTSHVPTSPSSPLLSVPECEQQLTPDVSLSGLVKEPPKSRKIKRQVFDCVEIPIYRALNKHKRLLNVKPPVTVQSQTTLETQTGNSSFSIYAADAMEHSCTTETTNTLVGMEVDEDGRQPNRTGDGTIPMGVNIGGYIDAGEQNKCPSEQSHAKACLPGRDSGIWERRTKARIRRPVTHITARVTQGLARHKRTSGKGAGGRTHAGADDAEASRPGSANEQVRQILVKDPTLPSSSEDSDTTTAPHPGSAERFNPPAVTPVIRETVDRSVSYDSDAAVASQWLESDGLPKTSTIRAKAPAKPARTRGVPEETLSIWHSASFSAPTEAGRKKNNSTAITRQRPISSPSSSSTVIDSTGARPSHRTRRRVDNELPNDYGPELVAALNSASNANQISFKSPSKKKRRIYAQTEMDDRFSMRDHERPVADECPHPPLAAEPEEECKRRIHELESRLALVEARNQPKQIADQVIDAVVHRMKEVMPVFPHVPTPQQVYLTPIPVGPLIGPEGGLNYFPMPNEPHGYRANRNGNTRFYPHSREPNPQSGWSYPPYPTDQYWRSHHTGPRQDFRHRQPNIHHNNNPHSNNNRPFPRLGMQRRRQQYGDFYNRDRPNGGEVDTFNARRPGDNGFRIPHSEETERQAGANEFSQRTRQGPSDLDRRGDELPGPSEPRQQTTSEGIAGPSPREGMAPRHHLTPPLSEQQGFPRADTEPHGDQDNQQTPSRPDSDELTCEWEINYELDDRDGENMKKTYDKAPASSNSSGAAFNNVLENNPWLS